MQCYKLRTFLPIYFVGGTVSFIPKAAKRKGKLSIGDSVKILLILQSMSLFVFDVLFLNRKYLVMQ